MFEDETNENWQSLMEIWICMELMAYFNNIGSIMVFLVFTWKKPYWTIREKLGLAHETGPFSRKECDYLTYCKEDIHLFGNWFTIVGLDAFTIFLKGKNSPINRSMGLCAARHCCCLYVLYTLYFSHDKAVRYQSLEKLLSLFYTVSLIPMMWLFY